MVTRRNLLIGGIGSAVVAGGYVIYSRPKVINAAKQPWSLKTQGLIKDISQGKPLLQENVKLDIAHFIENGYQANFKVTMPFKKPADIKMLYVIASHNPNPICARFSFTPLSGDIMVQSRLRLASSQQVIALAEMEDGTIYIDQKLTDVHIKGCTP